MEVISDLKYTAPLELYEREKPFFSNVPAPDGRQSNQAIRNYGNIKFQDIRPNLDAYGLDLHGFEVVRYGEETTVGDWDSDQWIAKSYYPTVEEVLKARLGNVQILIFDHTVRRRQTSDGLQAAGKYVRATRQPSLSAHADQTFLSGANRVKFHMGSEAHKLLQGRCQIINVWRPLFGPLEDYPLTYCDCRTVDAERDYVAADLIFPHYVGEQFLVKHHPDHRWFFLSKQQTNEFTLMKCWDNDEHVARCVPHTSFYDPTTPETARKRESIEFRCLVFHS